MKKPIPPTTQFRLTIKDTQTISFDDLKGEFLFGLYDTIANLKYVLSASLDNQFAFSDGEEMILQEKTLQTLLEKAVNDTDYEVYVFKDFLEFASWLRR